MNRRAIEAEEGGIIRSLLLILIENGLMDALICMVFNITWNGKGFGKIWYDPQTVLYQLGWVVGLGMANLLFALVCARFGLHTGASTRCLNIEFMLAAAPMCCIVWMMIEGESRPIVGLTMQLIPMFLIVPRIIGYAGYLEKRYAFCRRPLRFRLDVSADANLLIRMEQAASGLLARYGWVCGGARRGVMLACTLVNRLLWLYFYFNVIVFSAVAEPGDVSLFWVGRQLLRAVLLFAPGTAFVWGARRLGVVDRVTHNVLLAQDLLLLIFFAVMIVLAFSGTEINAQNVTMQCMMFVGCAGVVASRTLSDKLGG